LKVLYLDHPEQDFLAYQIYDGLCTLLGEDNVIVYPEKRCYWGAVDDWYILDDGKRGYTAPGAYMKKRKRNTWIIEEIKTRLHEIDLFILASPRTYAINALKTIKEFCNPHPLVFMDGEDSDIIRDDIIQQFRVDFAFKRELFRNEPGIYPLPFSSVCYDYPDSSIKDIDVFYSVGWTHPLREKVRDKLVEATKLKDFNIVARCNSKDAMMGYKEYLDCMSRAKINIICRGHGVDTVRAWEAVSFSGLVLSDRIDLVIPNAFTEGINIDYYDQNNLDHLVDKIVYYLKNDAERQLIGKQGKERLCLYHTSEKRAQYLLDIVDRERKINYGGN